MLCAGEGEEVAGSWECHIYLEWLALIFLLQTTLGVMVRMMKAGGA